MARPASPVAFLATALLLTIAPAPAISQRPQLTGEKARVADAVKRDLSRLATLQRTPRGRTRSFDSDPKDLNFTPTSGAEVTIAFASANAWAANASHDALAPVKCFVIVSASDAADAPTSQPFCTDADPNTPAGRVAAAGAASTTSTPATQPETETKAPARQAAPRSNPPVNTPANPAANSQRISLPTNRARGAANPANSGNAGSSATAPVAAPRAEQGAVRMITRDVGETSLAERIETVTATEFSNIVAGMAREAVATMDAPPPVVTRDPYESTQEFETRKAAAMAEYEARETEWFKSQKRSFLVTVPVRNVRYDADTELLEFAVDAIRLPNTRQGRSQLTVACFTRPVFWCMPDTGLTYDANDLWKIPRASARQFDVLRTPLTLTARFTVGGRADAERALAVQLVDLELHTRGGEVVQRWAGR